MAKNACTEVAGIWSVVAPTPGVEAEPAISGQNGRESASAMTGIVDPELPFAMLSPIN